jgi:hypothetical protein
VVEQITRSGWCAHSRKIGRARHHRSFAGCEFSRGQAGIGEDSWTLPIPARYVIAQDRTIAYAEVNADYTRRPEPSAIFPVLGQLGRRV